MTLSSQFAVKLPSKPVPMAQKLVAAKPAAQKPPAQKPAAAKPTTPKAAIAKPPAAKPSAAKPAAAKQALVPAVPKPAAKPAAPKQALVPAVPKPAVPAVPKAVNVNEAIQIHNNAILQRNPFVARDIRPENKRIIEKWNNPQRKKCCGGLG